MALARIDPTPNPKAVTTNGTMFVRLRSDIWDHAPSIVTEPGRVTTLLKDFAQRLRRGVSTLIITSFTTSRTVADEVKRHRIADVASCYTAKAAKPHSMIHNVRPSARQTRRRVAVILSNRSHLRSSRSRRRFSGSSSCVENVIGRSTWWR